MMRLCEFAANGPILFLEGYATDFASVAFSALAPIGQNATPFSGKMLADYPAILRVRIIAFII